LLGTESHWYTRKQQWRCSCKKNNAVTYNTHFCTLHWPKTPYLCTHSQWQQEWDFQPNNKLHKIYPNVHCIRPLSSQFSWRDQVVCNRLRIGHSYTTHSYLLHKDPQPLCIPGHSPFSIEHILTQCIDFLNTNQPLKIHYC